MHGPHSVMAALRDCKVLGANPTCARAAGCQPHNHIKARQPAISGSPNQTARRTHLGSKECKEFGRCVPLVATPAAANQRGHEAPGNAARTRAGTSKPWCSSTHTSMNVLAPLPPRSAETADATGGGVPGVRDWELMPTRSSASSRSARTHTAHPESCAASRATRKLCTVK